MRRLFPALLFTCAACVTPQDLTDNDVAFSAKSAKSQAELVGCVATAWAEFRMALQTIPTPERTTLTLEGLYGSEARADIYSDSRIEVRLRNALIKGNSPLIKPVESCV